MVRPERVHAFENIERDRMIAFHLLRLLDEADVGFLRGGVFHFQIAHREFQISPGEALIDVVACRIKGLRLWVDGRHHGVDVLLVEGIRIILNGLIEDFGIGSRRLLTPSDDERQGRHGESGKDAGFPGKETERRAAFATGDERLRAKGVGFHENRAFGFRQ